LFKGISNGDGSVNLSHLFYADDAVFVGQWSDNNITTLVHVLECFHKRSSLRINMCKSKLIGLHVDGELVHRAARQLGCLVLNLPFSYLGLIVGDNMARQQAWGGIVDRVKKKLSKFFNGHVQDSKKASWLNWNNVIMSKDRGRLGVSSLYAIDRGLLVKWGHNSCWRNIIKEVESLSKQGIHVLNYLRIKLGDGMSSKFWIRSWSDEGVLKDMFPRVYALESCKNITIADKVRQENPYQTFRRTPRGGVEQEQFQHVDRISRKMIDDALIHSPNLNYRWNKYVPIKVNILVWKILNNSLPTKFNISRRGILIDSIICPNCDVGVETVGHLFFSCSMSRDIFNLIARWWKLSIENFDCYDEWLEWIDSIRMSKKTKIMMEAIFYTSWWMIWWFRNSKIFKEKAPKKACFFDELQSKSFMWCRFRGNKSFGWNDWLNHPECISL
nr:RNA-directed DNA polymerase, eukaryota, reverse transcriptase zinc-binding domain protein [Tanacetum cinerariifolium]